jgi:dTDP-4-dehydrorhamnose reductase
MNKMKIIGTGLNGLVGTRIVELLKDKYNFQNISRSTGVDITDKVQITNAITSSDAPIVLHLTAKTDVDECERDKEADSKFINDSSFWGSANQRRFQNRDSGQARMTGLSTAWAVNVIGTQNVVEACKKANKKIIYVSTDFVFDGSQGNYTEEYKPNPLNWYGKTKFEGEKIVVKSGLDFIIMRIAYPYCRPHPIPLLTGEGEGWKVKMDFVQTIISRLQNNQIISGVTDHIFVPTFIDDIASCIDVLIHGNMTGIYHAVGSQVLSPYNAALAIADVFGYNRSLIEKTTREEFFKNRAPRPYNLSLNNDKIVKLEVKMRGFEEGLREINK